MEGSRSRRRLGQRLFFLKFEFRFAKHPSGEIHADDGLDFACHLFNEDPCSATAIEDSLDPSVPNNRSKSCELYVPSNQKIQYVFHTLNTLITDTSGWIAQVGPDGF